MCLWMDLHRQVAFPRLDRGDTALHILFVRFYLTQQVGREAEKLVVDCP